MAGWQIRASGARKAIVRELEAARDVTLEGDGIDPGTDEQMTAAISAVDGVVKLLSGKGKVEVQAAASSHDDQIQVTITASKATG